MPTSPLRALTVSALAVIAVLAAGCTSHTGVGGSSGAAVSSGSGSAGAGGSGAGRSGAGGSGAMGSAAMGSGAAGSVALPTAQSAGAGPSIIVGVPGPSSGAASTTPATAPLTAASGSSSLPSLPKISTIVATTTIGNTTAGLDKASKTWFDTMCTGLAPAAALAQQLSSTSESTDPGQAQSQLAHVFATDGSSFTVTAEKLKALPSPGFHGGAGLAAKFVPVFGQLGSLFSTTGRQLEAVDVSSNPAGLQSVLTAFGSSMGQLSGTLASLLGTAMTPATASAIRAIPSCKKVDAAFST